LQKDIILQVSAKTGVFSQTSTYILSEKRRGAMKEKFYIMEHNVILGVELEGEYDYIVVGAGSAGVAVARRLADAGM
jgi:hypothetical protein